MTNLGMIVEEYSQHRYIKTKWAPQQNAPSNESLTCVFCRNPKQATYSTYSTLDNGFAATDAETEICVTIFWLVFCCGSKVRVHMRSR